MNKKVCAICGKEYPDTKRNFPKKKNYTICKACINEQQKLYFRGVNGLITKMYNSQKRISEKYYHNFPFYTKEEFKTWVLSKDNFEQIMTDYIESSYERDLAPHCTRIDKSNPFKFDNLKLCTWKEGRIYSMSVKKLTGNKVLKYKDDVLIDTYVSMKNAYNDNEIDVTYESFITGIKKNDGVYKGFEWKIEFRECNKKRIKGDLRC